MQRFLKYLRVLHALHFCWQLAVFMVFLCWQSCYTGMIVICLGNRRRCNVLYVSSPLQKIFLLDSTTELLESPSACEAWVATWASYLKYFTKSNSGAIQKHQLKPYGAAALFLSPWFSGRPENCFSKIRNVVWINLVTTLMIVWRERRKNCDGNFFLWPVCSESLWTNTCTIRDWRLFPSGLKDYWF